MTRYNALIGSIDIGFSSKNLYNLNDCKRDIRIDDSEFWDFVKEYNGGYFFSKALHIYGKSDLDFHDIQKVNTLINNSYGAIADSKVFFASDIFGNQFCFDGKSKRIVFFNLETGDTELIADSFSDWVRVILSDSDYYTGESIIQAWEELMMPVEYDQRLTPKVLFVLGGEYHPNNLRTENWKTIIGFNASIAKQIYGLPDGTDIEIRIEQ